MSKKQTKEDIENKIAELQQEAARLKIRLSSIEDQISDFFGDLRIMQAKEKSDSDE